MIIKRVASTVLFLLARDRWHVMNNAVGVPLFLFSQTQFNVHIIELIKAFLLLRPELEFLYDFATILNSWVLLIFFPIARIMLYFVFLFVKKSFVEQSSLTFLHKPKSTIRNGLVTYIIFAIIGAVFFISAVGIFFTAILFIVACFFSLVGESSIAIILGKFISRRFLKKKLRIETDMLIGALVMELLRLIPVLGVVVSVIIIPTIALGAITIAAVDGGIRKILYYSDYDENTGVNDFNYSELRGIIMGESEGGDCYAKEEA